jgi:hypothetical protein
MTLAEFFRRLQLKGYEHDLVYSKAHYASKINLMEVDRINVFKAWYGVKVTHMFNMDRPKWQFKLMQAQEDFLQEYIPTTIHYILSEQEVDLNPRAVKKTIQN